MPIYKKFSPEQANNLREILDASNFYPSKKKIKEIAKSMRMPILKIENWFKYNRRKMHFKGEFGEYKLRKSFKKSELTHLKSLYETNSSPSFIECAQISKELSGITPEQVKNWFANQRRKIKTISTQSVDLKIENRVSKAKEKEPEANENENVESMASLKIDHSKERKNLEDFIKFEKEPTQVPDQKLKIDLQTNNQLLFDESTINSFVNANFYKHLSLFNGTMFPNFMNCFGQPYINKIDMSLYNYYYNSLRNY